MNEAEEERIDLEFEDLVNSLNDIQFWTFIKNWFDTGYLWDIMKDWDTETKRRAIETIKGITK